MDEVVFEYICHRRGCTFWSGVQAGERLYYLGETSLQDDHTDVIEYKTYVEVVNACMLSQFKTVAIAWLTA